MPALRHLSVSIDPTGRECREHVVGRLAWINAQYRSGDCRTLTRHVEPIADALKALGDLIDLLLGHQAGPLLSLLVLRTAFP